MKERKGSAGRCAPPHQDEACQTAPPESTSPISPRSQRSFIVSSLWHGVYVTIGLALLVACCLGVAEYLQLLHENSLWFSSLTEMEREISFRTEQGFYYSFFKQFIKSGSMTAGMEALSQDRATEHGREINSLRRFNLFPETVLSWVYMYFEPNMPASIFYADAVFGVQMVLVAAMYLISWSLCGSWLGGLLSVAFFLVNRSDVTRINYSIGLREGFALPFLFAHFGSVGYCLKKKLDAFQEFCGLAIAFGTACFALLSWQLVPFVLTVEIFLLMSMQFANFIGRQKVFKLATALALAITSAWAVQFYATYLVRSAALTAAFVAVTSAFWPDFRPAPGRDKVQDGRQFKKLFANAVVFACYVIFAGAVVFTLNFYFRGYVGGSEDEAHVFRFLFSRLLGKQHFRDFEVQLYLCHEAFDALDEKILSSLTEGWLFPAYNLFAWAWSMSLGAAVVADWTGKASSASEKAEAERSKGDGSDKNAKTKKSKDMKISFAALTSERPDLVFHLGMSVAFAVAAAIMKRMLCLWAPYMCILAAAGISDRRIWSGLFDADAIRRRCSWAGDVARLAVYGLVAAALFYKFDVKFGKELTDLREFHDPDTVNLLNWITGSTPSSAVFAGSMQLMSAVKASTGRAITNHPHFEDAWLRNRTKRVYQIYGHKGPEEVHGILNKMGATHFIVEESICSEGPAAPRQSGAQFCRLTDTVDLMNGHVPATMRGEKAPNDLKLAHPKAKLFCEALDTPNTAYSILFKAEYKNPTFRVYKVVSAVGS